MACREAHCPGEWKAQCDTALPSWQAHVSVLVVFWLSVFDLNAVTLSRHGLSKWPPHICVCVQVSITGPSRKLEKCEFRKTERQIKPNGQAKLQSSKLNRCYCCCPACWRQTRPLLWPAIASMRLSWSVPQLTRIYHGLNGRFSLCTNLLVVGVRGRAFDKATYGKGPV